MSPRSVSPRNMGVIDDSQAQTNPMILHNDSNAHWTQGGLIQQQQQQQQQQQYGQQIQHIPHTHIVPDTHESDDSSEQAEGMYDDIPEGGGGNTVGDDEQGVGVGVGGGNTAGVVGEHGSVRGHKLMKNSNKYQPQNDYIEPENKNTSGGGRKGKYKKRNSQQKHKNTAGYELETQGGKAQYGMCCVCVCVYVCVSVLSFQNKKTVESWLCYVCGVSALVRCE